MLEQLRVAGAGGPVDESEVIAGAMELGYVAHDGLKPGFVGAKTVLQALAEPGISLVPIQYIFRYPSIGCEPLGTGVAAAPVH